MFFDKFLIALFEKLEVKLLYNSAYHLEIDGSSKRKNQTVEIALQSFLHVFNNPGL